MPTEKADTPKGRTVLEVLFDRWWKKVIAGIIAFTVAALILIPYAIRYGAKRMILAQATAAKPESTTESSPSVAKKPPADRAQKESVASTSAAAGSAVVQLPPEQLQELAQSRSMTIKDLLVGQYGIKDDRILLCHPEIDKTAKGKPRAEILF